MVTVFRRAMAAAAAAVYYGLGRHLPPTNVPGGRLFTGARCLLARRFVTALGTNVDLSRGVYLGLGRDIRIGNHSGIGIGCELHGPLTVGENVMISPGVI